MVRFLSYCFCFFSRSKLNIVHDWYLLSFAAIKVIAGGTLTKGRHMEQHARRIPGMRRRGVFLHTQRACE